MRQAGGYLPEYRALRQKPSLLELSHKPELATQVTLQPVERLGVDAAILFADILLPFEPLGLGLTFSAGEGPQITRPVREAGQVLALPPVDPATDLAYVLEAVRLAARALPPHVPLIGFAGAPFTLASYAIEGGATRSFTLTQRVMYLEPRGGAQPLGRLGEAGGASCWNDWQSWWGRTWRPRRAPARARCSCSTAGWGVSRPPITPPTCFPTASGRSSWRPRRVCR